MVGLRNALRSFLIDSPLAGKQNRSMQNTLPKTESHPQFLAHERRKKAVTLFVRAGAIMAIPVIAYFGFDMVFPLWGYILFLIAARLAYTEAGEKWLAAKRAEQGAAGEDEIAKTLEQLPKGWSVERGVALDRIGDIDFLLQSPNGKTFVLEVKAHKGKISWNGNALCRISKGVGIPFEKDFLTQTLSQVTTIKELRRLQFVNAVLVFTQARVVMDNREHRHVHILQQDELIKYLLTAAG